MKGKYHLVVGNNKITYELDIERQVTVINGDSGTGKTTLYSMFHTIYFSSSYKRLGYKCNCADKIVTLHENAKLEDLNGLSNKIIIADESCSLIYTLEFASFVSNSDLYFILISRKYFKWLTYSVDSIYELSTDNKVTKLVKRYKDISSIIKADLVVSEDSGSGNDLLNKVINGVVSAKGKDRVYYLLEQSKFSHALVFVDGAAFGNCLMRLVSKFGDRISIKAPESIEYILLSTSLFKRYLGMELVETYNYCDTKDFVSWEQYYTYLLKHLVSSNYAYTYNKSKLIPLFTTKKIIDEVKDLIYGEDTIEVVEEL